MNSKLIQKIIHSEEKIWLFIRHAFKFGIVGVLNTIVCLGTILLLQNVFSVYYVIANIVGYPLGLINSFIWNKLWTFKSKKFVKKEILLFLLIALISYAIQFSVLRYVVEILKVNENWAQVISALFYTIPNFLGNKFITFKK